MSLYVADGAVPTCAKLLQPAPWQRSTRYPVTPTLSVDAVQLKLIWVPLTAVALRLPGVLGGCVSGEVVVALAVFEYGSDCPLHRSRGRDNYSCSLSPRSCHCMSFRRGRGPDLCEAVAARSLTSLH